MLKTIHIYTIIFYLFIFFFPLSLFAQKSLFFDNDSFCPNVTFLSSPPKPTDSAFYNDWYRYQWGKQIRTTERGKLAIKDADWSLDYLLTIFSQPFGININKKNTPEIFKLLDMVYQSGDICSRKLKKANMRIRPYILFNESTLISKKEEKELKDDSSYPSGHSALGWTFALVLSEINPNNGSAILKRGFEYGESRVIVGFHYQSDVDVARIASSIFINQLHTNNEFLQQLQKAKIEFSNKMKK